MASLFPGFQHFVSVAVPRPLDGFFTYAVDAAHLPRVVPGAWVEIPFGRGRTHGFVVETPFGPEGLPPGLDPDVIKPILSVGSDGPVVGAELLELCRWISDYYRSPVGEVFNAAVPASTLGLRTARREARDLDEWDAEDLDSAAKGAGKGVVELHDEQAAATAEILRGIDGGKPKPVLLHGVTGSGKTEVYLAVARELIRRGKSVIFLVPEIALTPQLHHRLESGLGERVALWHSAVPSARRRDEAAALRAGRIRAVLGARSGVFAPVRDLGMIVVDEEHDATYKQEDRVRYQARDVAILRAQKNGAAVLLGSATPSLETRERVREGRYVELKLDRRHGLGGIPAIECVNLAEEEPMPDARTPMAQRTIQILRDTLNAGQQAMVFLNRRGFAPLLLCEDCGETSGCPNCSITLTLHRKANHLRCHLCGHQEGIPELCQKCHGTNFNALGTGTEALEEELPRWVPEARVLRLDRDQVTSASRLEKVLSKFRAGESNVLLGTQMLVKGHDFPNVTLVIVVLADALFRWPDFRAPERAWQILTQVAGRAGRGDVPGRVLIQTYQPDHPVLAALKDPAKLDDFLESERDLRSVLGYPPFGRMARIRIEDSNKGIAENAAKNLAKGLMSSFEPAELELLGPSEAFLERVKGLHRWDLVLKARSVTPLQRALGMAKQWSWKNPGSRMIVDVDPQGVG